MPALLRAWAITPQSDSSSKRVLEAYADQTVNVEKRDLTGRNVATMLFGQDISSHASGALTDVELVSPALRR